MPHHRARHTPLGRWEVVRRVVEEGETFAQAAAWANVSKSTVWEWVRRWRRRIPGGPRVAGVPGRALQPPAALAGAGARRGGRSGSASCAGAPAGARAGSPTSPTSPGRTRPSIRCCGAAAARARSPPSARRSSATSGRAPATCCTWTSRSFGKFTEPGHAVTGDRTRRSRRVGWEYCHSIVDDCSRLAYSELHDDERAATVTAFTQRALDWFLEHGIVAERLMTDNAFSYTQNKRLRDAAARPRDRSPAHAALHATHQRQGRALPADAATRVGLRARVRLKRGPSGLAATLGAPLQRAAHPQRPRQPPSHRPRSGGHRARQLAPQTHL